MLRPPPLRVVSLIPLSGVLGLAACSGSATGPPPPEIVVVPARSITVGTATTGFGQVVLEVGIELEQGVIPKDDQRIGFRITTDGGDEEAFTSPQDPILIVMKEGHVAADVLDRVSSIGLVPTGAKGIPPIPTSFNETRGFIGGPLTGVLPTVDALKQAENWPEVKSAFLDAGLKIDVIPLPIDSSQVIVTKRAFVPLSATVARSDFQVARSQAGPTVITIEYRQPDGSVLTATYTLP